jgi:succinylglutamate desuccinylase
LSDLVIKNSFPSELLECDATELYKYLSGPTLFHIAGESSEVLFISVLLHGNEHSGLIAVQEILKKYSNGQTLPRSISLLIGNVIAAKENLRVLPDGLDFNRVWNLQEASPVNWSGQVVDEMKKKNLFACIDIHNNTGINPYYACVNALDVFSLNLAKSFSDTIVYFLKPSEVCSIEFTKLCPSTTIECGLSNDVNGISRASLMIDNALNNSRESFEVEINWKTLNVFHTVAIIKVPNDCNVAFGDENTNADFLFPANFEYFNFSNVDREIILGKRLNDSRKLVVVDEKQQMLTDDLITYDCNEIKLKKGLVPSMFTKNKAVIYQDCLGYLMEKISKSVKK